MPAPQTNRERLKEVTAQIEEGIRGLFQSEKYIDYLRTMSRFHKYSVNNTVLIHMQMPNATHVAGYNKWKDQFQRHVKKGESGITIIAPTPFRKKIEEQKLDPDTKAPILDKDGNAVMEEREIEIPTFKPVKVFDVSQTEGKPLPHLASTLTGSVQNYDAFMEALRRTSPVPIRIEAMTAKMDGYFDSEHQDIAIRKGMSEVQTVSAAVHEITHATLHNYEQKRLATVQEDKDPPQPKDRRTEEVEAESVSYAVCQYYGIETGENSFGYIATWSKDRSLPELRASLETINRTANDLISGIDRHFRGVCKERSIDLTADQKDEVASLEPEIPAPEQAEGPHQAQELLLVLDDTTYLHIQATDTGYDYTLYDVETMKQLDGGQLDNPDIPISTAALEICQMYDMGKESIKYAPQDMIETLQEAADQQMQNEAAQVEPDTPQPDAPNSSYVKLTEHILREDDAMWEDTPQPERPLDEYPMPDPALSMDGLLQRGNENEDLVPINREQAQKYLDADFCIYALGKDGSAYMCFDLVEITDAPPDTIFAMPKEGWEITDEFAALVHERMDHQQEREAAFLSHSGDCFAIYKVKRDEDHRNYRYEPLERLEAAGLAVERGHYDLVYTAPLTELSDDMLEKLFRQFNLEPPADYCQPAMSVSDIVAIKREGAVSCHYCDSFGFRDIPGFLDNPLKNAEMSLEDDYGMIDGIINNGPKEPEKKPSVVERLKIQPRQERKNQRRKGARKWRFDI